jgi:hypothetical protein
MVCPKEGELSVADIRWWQQANAFGDPSYPDPTSVVSDVYDRVRNAGAEVWFRTTAADLVGHARSYVRLVERYGVVCVERRSSSHGTIVYEDDVQIVVVPIPGQAARGARGSLKIPGPAGRHARRPARPQAAGGTGYEKGFGCGGGWVSAGVTRSIVGVLVPIGK